MMQEPHSTTGISPAPMDVHEVCAIMPNMLAHIGVQGVVTKTLLRDADPRWVFLGCLLPDFPWILQRFGHAFMPGLNAYDLRLYTITQASLTACILLCGALALYSSQPLKIFRVLALNAVLHLLLDACETKWANGVHLFAPFSWELLNFGLFWPESWLILLLTIFGLTYGVRAWWHMPPPLLPSTLRPPWQRRCATLLIVAYVVLPMAFCNGPYAMDNHSVKTLKERELRTGRPVEFDRNLYLKHPLGDYVRTFAREELRVTGKKSEHSGLVSIRAMFVDPTTIHIDTLHTHWGASRDLASYLGLALLVMLWLRPYIQRARGCRNTL
jgi:hypothetical protein